MNWKMVTAVIAALVIGFGVIFRMATRLPQPPEQQLFINGTVLTMDVDNRVVEALATRGDRIEAVGSTEEIMALAGEGTEVIDLRGRALLPGFIDAHGHFPGSGLKVVAADLNSPPIGTLTSMDEVLAALAQQAEKNACRPVGLRLRLRRYSAGGTAPPDPGRAGCRIQRSPGGGHAYIRPYGGGKQSGVGGGGYCRGYA